MACPDIPHIYLHYFVFCRLETFINWKVLYQNISEKSYENLILIIRKESKFKRFIIADLVTKFSNKLFEVKEVDSRRHKSKVVSMKLNEFYSIYFNSTRRAGKQGIS